MAGAQKTTGERLVEGVESHDDDRSHVGSVEQMTRKDVRRQWRKVAV